MRRAKALILPVEFQVREFDAKLLLAAVAAERGIPTYLGFQNTIRDRITELPTGTYIAKGFASRRPKMLDILVQLGHRVCAWDEEGLVRYPPEIYYDRRISEASLQRLSDIFAWGHEYVDLIRKCPFYDGTPIHETGNPRVDLLRPELRSFYDEPVSDIKRRFGRFVLINSSFGFANLATSNPTAKQQGTAEGLEASADFWKGQLEYRARLFTLFREMTVALAAKFPGTQFIVRPHPAENFDSWVDFASGHANLEIVAEGNVVPWLLAAEGTVHNGCMTAIEGALLDKPILSYQPLTSQAYDRHLPNAVSHPCESLPVLFDSVEKVMRGELGPKSETELWSALGPHLFRPGTGRLCCDAIVDVVADGSADASAAADSGRSSYATTWMQAQTKALGKRLRRWRGDGVYSSAHQRQQFPEIEVAEVERRLARLQSALGRFSRVAVQPVRDDLFVLAER